MEQTPQTQTNIQTVITPESLTQTVQSMIKRLVLNWMYYKKVSKQEATTAIVQTVNSFLIDLLSEFPQEGENIILELDAFVDVINKESRVKETNKEMLRRIVNEIKGDLK
jgi:hypothetical protein